MRDRRDNGLHLGANGMHCQHVVLWCTRREVRLKIEILVGCFSRYSRRKWSEKFAELHALVDDTLHGRICSVRENAAIPERARPPFGFALHPPNDGAVSEKAGDMINEFLIADTCGDQVEPASSNGDTDFRRVEWRAKIWR